MKQDWRQPEFFTCKAEDCKEQNNKMSELEQLKEKLKIAEKALNHVLNSALHPDIAIRALMVDLRPVREALEKLKE